MYDSVNKPCNIHRERPGSSQRILDAVAGGRVAKCKLEKLVGLMATARDPAKSKSRPAKGRQNFLKIYHDGFAFVRTAAQQRLTPLIQPLDRLVQILCAPGSHGGHRIVRFHRRHGHAR